MTVAESVGAQDCSCIKCASMDWRSFGVRRTLTRSGRGASPVVLRPDSWWWTRLRSPPMVADGPSLESSTRLSGRDTTPDATA